MPQTTSVASELASKFTSRGLKVLSEFSVVVQVARKVSCDSEDNASSLQWNVTSWFHHLQKMSDFLLSGVSLPCIGNAPVGETSIALWVMASQVLGIATNPASNSESKFSWSGLSEGYPFRQTVIGNLLLSRSMKQVLCSGRKRIASIYWGPSPDSRSLVFLCRLQNVAFLKALQTDILPSQR